MAVAWKGLRGARRALRGLRVGPHAGHPVAEQRRLHHAQPSLERAAVRHDAVGAARGGERRAGPPLRRARRDRGPLRPARRARPAGGAPRSVLAPRTSRASASPCRPDPRRRSAVPPGRTGERPDRRHPRPGRARARAPGARWPRTTPPPGRAGGGISSGSDRSSSSRRRSRSRWWHRYHRRWRSRGTTSRFDASSASRTSCEPVAPITASQSGPLRLSSTEQRTRNRAVGRGSEDITSARR